MKRFLNLFLVFTLVFSTILLASCSCNKDDETTKVMQVSCNPSVEFILDKDNKVVSVTALNEDGNVILAGETFIGLTSDEAVKLFTQVATETGFIIKGSVEANQNEISISISGNTNEAKKLYESAKKQITSYLEEKGITATISDFTAITTDKIKETVKEYYNLAEEELNKLSEEDLIKHLQEIRTETKELYSQGLKEAYTSMRDYELNLAENEKVLEIISSIDGAYSQVITQYTAALNTLKDLKAQIEETRKTYLIEEDSLYQTALDNLNNAKNELVEKRNEVANMEEGTLKEAAKLALTALEASYNNALASYNAAFTAFNGAFDLVIQSLTTAETALQNIKNNLPEEIKTTLQNKASEIDNAVNTTKNTLFTNFEQKYNTQIEAAKQDALARKNALKAAIAE